MESFRPGKSLFSLILSISAFLWVAAPGHALLSSPDPSETAEEYALLVSTADGAIHAAKVKMKLADIRFGGRGELRAHLHYELATGSGEWSLNHAVSKSLPVESLSLESASSMEFDFRENLILGHVNPVSLKIYHQDNSPNPPLIVAEFGGDRLLVEEKESPFQSAPPPEGGALIWGPETFLRERGKPAVGLSSRARPGSFSARTP